MDEKRRAWLQERRAAVVAEYDDEAPTYDEDEYPVPLHGSFVGRLLAMCPPGGLVLDAPCGTGKYFAQVTQAGRRVVGADQSAGMLAQARARGLAEDLVHVGLQELAFDAEFDAAMTIDAMENVPPEDWPLVLRNLARAVRDSGPLYMTVEESTEATIDEAYRSLTEAGVPAVRGELIEGDVAGYHFYPPRDRVVGWLADAGLEIVDEDFDQQEGYGYRHLIVRAR